LLTHRRNAGDCGSGQTLVSSALIDRVSPASAAGLVETPVGFKWFSRGCWTADSASAAKKAPAQFSPP